MPHDISQLPSIITSTSTVHHHLYASRQRQKPSTSTTWRQLGGVHIECQLCDWVWYVMCGSWFCQSCCHGCVLLLVINWMPAEKTGTATYYGQFWHICYFWRPTNKWWWVQYGWWVIFYSMWDIFAWMKSFFIYLTHEKKLKKYI